MAIRHVTQIILPYVHINNEGTVLRNSMKEVVDVPVAWSECRPADSHTVDLDVTQSKVGLLR